jgi:hypothetical protein
VVTSDVVVDREKEVEQRKEDQDPGHEGIAGDLVPSRGCQCSAQLARFDSTTPSPSSLSLSPDPVVRAASSSRLQPKLVATFRRNVRFGAGPDASARRLYLTLWGA